MMARQNTPIYETLALEEILVEESTYLKRRCNGCDIDEVLLHTLHYLHAVLLVWSVTK